MVKVPTLVKFSNISLKSLFFFKWGDITNFYIFQCFIFLFNILSENLNEEIKEIKTSRAESCPAP